MSDYDEHLISMAGGDGDELDAAAKVAEWARQWRLYPNIDKSGTIYNVWFDPAASAVELNLNDIEALLALVRDQRAAIDRVEEVAKEYDGYAEHLTDRAAGYIDGEYKSRHLSRASEERERAARIRTALEPTP